jgi:hypothetical protein
VSEAHIPNQRPGLSPAFFICIEVIMSMKSTRKWKACYIAVGQHAEPEASFTTVEQRSSSAESRRSQLGKQPHLHGLPFC